MSTLLTLEGRRIGLGQIQTQRIKPKIVNSKGRRGTNMVAKPLTCAALSGSMHRYDLELSGLGKKVRKVKEVKKVYKYAKPLVLTDFEKLVFDVRMELGIHRPLAYYVIKNKLTNKHPSDLTPKQFELLKKLNLASINGKNLKVTKGDLLAGFFNNELNGLGSFVSRQAKKATRAVKAVSKNVVKVTPKPLKKIVKVNTYLLTKPLEQTTKAIGLAARGQYASALKTASPISTIPKSFTNKVVSKAKKTVVGRNIVKAASTVDKKVSKKINKEAKGVIVKAVTAAYGPAAGAAANKFLPEGATPSKAATVVDQIVQSPIAQTPTVASVTKAEEIIESTPVTSEAKSSSSVGIIAAIAAAAMFML